MVDFDERVAYINEMAEAKGYSQAYVDFLKDCAEWAREHQWDEIRNGLESGVDVSVYANSKFDELQMMQIRFGLADRLNVSEYADPKFDGRQMREIRGGLKSGVDITVYADPKFDSFQIGGDSRGS